MFRQMLRALRVWVNGASESYNRTSQTLSWSCVVPWRNTVPFVLLDVANLYFFSQLITKDKIKSGKLAKKTATHFACNHPKFNEVRRTALLCPPFWFAPLPLWTPPDATALSFSLHPAFTPFQKGVGWQQACAHGAEHVVFLRALPLRCVPVYVRYRT